MRRPRPARLAVLVAGTLLVGACGRQDRPEEKPQPLRPLPRLTAPEERRVLAKETPSAPEASTGRREEALEKLAQAEVKGLARNPEESPWRISGSPPRPGEASRRPPVLMPREHYVLFDWRWYRYGNRVRLEARIQNLGTSVIEAGRAQVTVWGYGGKRIDRREVLFESRGLAPGEETYFSFLLPPTNDYSPIQRCEFLLRDGSGRPLETSRPIETQKQAEHPE